MNRSEECKEYLEYLLKNELIPNFIAFQSYDFTLSMFGKFYGMQKELSKFTNHHIPYNLCQAYPINTF